MTEGVLELMPWVKLDEHFTDNPKILKAGPIGMAMWVVGLAYCNLNQTNGFIPREKALAMFPAIVPGPDGKEMAFVAEFWIKRLLNVGLWEKAKGGYMVHDYAQYQPSKEEVAERHERRVEAGRAGGFARAQVRAEAQANALANAKQNASKPLANAKQNASKPLANAKQNASKGLSKPLANFKPVTVTVTVTDTNTNQVGIGGGGGSESPPKQLHVKTSLPSDFQVTEPMIEAAIRECGLTREELADQSMKFRDWAIGREAFSWAAEWRQWMRRERDFRKKGGKPKPGENQERLDSDKYRGDNYLTVKGGNFDG
jgi:type IV secretory pathway TrbD component